MKKFWISLAVCSVCTLLTAWTRGLFAQTAPVRVFHILSDSFLIVGIMATSIAMIIFVSNEGAFDMIAYGWQVFGSIIRKDMSRRYDTFYDYRMARQERKSPFLFLLICGVIFLLLSVLMYVAYRKYV